MTRFSRTKIILASAALLLASHVPAFAEADAQNQAEAAATDAAKTGDTVKTEDAKKDAPAETQTATVQDPEKMKVYEQAAEKARAALKEIGQDLKEGDAKHFFLMYQNYNLIGTVKVVEKDVGNAIGECGKNNPDMKASLDDRYQKWNGAIDPIVKEAEANVSNMIIAQEYTDPAKIKSAFSSLDDARAATNASIDKRPVTTADACKHLLGKMDETEENLVELLRQTLVSFGRVAPADTVPTPVEEEKKKTSAEKLKL